MVRTLSLLGWIFVPLFQHTSYIFKQSRQLHPSGKDIFWQKFFYKENHTRNTREKSSDANVADDVQNKKILLNFYEIHDQRLRCFTKHIKRRRTIYEWYSCFHAVQFSCVGSTNFLIIWTKSSERFKDFEKKKKGKVRPTIDPNTFRLLLWIWMKTRSLTNINNLLIQYVMLVYLKKTKSILCGPKEVSTYLWHKYYNYSLISTVQGNRSLIFSDTHENVVSLENNNNKNHDLYRQNDMSVSNSWQGSAVT
jgi:hypothetical protein